MEYRLAWPAVALAAMVIAGCARSGDPAPEPPRSPDALSLRADGRLDTVLARVRADIEREMVSQGLPGLSIALVDRDGVVWDASFGTTTADGRPIDGETIFSVQSMSKTATATAVLAAVRDGLVDLDEPISTYLPGWTVNSRDHADPGSLITLRHLLSHRAGLTHEAPIGNNYDPDYPSWDAYVSSISSTWLRYPVGERYSYSNLGVDLAGQVLQTMSGVPFPEYVRREVFEPLGMARSSFDWETIRSDHNRAPGHAAGFDRVPLEFGLIPSGGMYASAPDVARFVRFHLSGGWVDGRQLIPRRLIEEMSTIQFRDERQVEGYGLGLGRYLRGGETFLNHNGGGFGFQSHMSWYPGYEVGLVVLTNDDSNNLSTALPGSVYDRILELALGDVPAGSPPYPDLRPDPDLVLDEGRYVGEYRGRGLGLSVAAEEGRIGLRFGPRFVPLDFVTAEEAILPMDGSLVRFEAAPDGRPRRMTRVNDGTVLDYIGGPDDSPGPDSPAWAEFEGSYLYTVWAQDTVTVTVSRRNGHLYLDDLRLDEHLPGLFFTPTGEALDLRGSPPTWRNIRLSRDGRR